MAKRQLNVRLDDELLKKLDSVENKTEIVEKALLAFLTGGGNDSTVAIQPAIQTVSVNSTPAIQIVSNDSTGAIQTVSVDSGNDSVPAIQTDSVDYKLKYAVIKGKYNELKSYTDSLNTQLTDAIESRRRADLLLAECLKRLPELPNAPEPQSQTVTVNAPAPPETTPETNAPVKTSAFGVTDVIFISILIGACVILYAFAR